MTSSCTCLENTIPISSLNVEKEIVFVWDHDYTTSNATTDSLHSVGDEALSTASSSGRKVSFVKCPECHKKLSHSGSLARHMRLHRDEKLYKCETCSRSFTTKGNFQNHLLTHQGKQFSCNICGWMFRLKHRLEKHKMEKHNENRKLLASVKTTYLCHICGKVVRCHSEFQIHLRSHTGETAYQCEVCGRGFNVKCNYRRHLLRHNKLKPYNCQICDRRFYEKRHMMLHMKKLHNMNRDDSVVIPDACVVPFQETTVPPGSNTPQPPLAKQQSSSPHEKQNTCISDNSVSEQMPNKSRQVCCSNCDLTFDNKASLRKHNKMMHKDLKTFSCSVCQKSFKTQKSLKSHELCHMSEGKFKCTVCPSTFKQHQGLWRHMQYHQDVKSHICHVCDKGFAIKGDLVRHQKTHAGKPFRCQNCGQHFDSQDKAISHVLACTSTSKVASLFMCNDCGMTFKNRQHVTKHRLNDCCSKVLADAHASTETTLCGADLPAPVDTSEGLILSDNLDGSQASEEKVTFAQVTQVWTGPQLMLMTM